MKPQDCGRFCSHCQKTVVDFTAFSNQELVEYFKKSTDVVCGHVLQSQLDMEIRDYSNFHISGKWGKYVVTTLLTFAGLSSKLWAQQVVQQMEIETADKDFNIKKEADKSPEDRNLIQIKGKVIDSLTSEPIIGCTVKDKYSDMMSMTDEYGNFQIDVVLKDIGDPVLVFEDFMHKMKECSFKKNTFQFVKLTRDENVVLDGAIIVVKKQTLWQRFKNIFRSRDY